MKKLLLVILSLLLFISCDKKSELKKESINKKSKVIINKKNIKNKKQKKKDIKNAVSIDIKYPKKVKTSSLIEPEINIKNNTDKTIAIILANLEASRISTTHKGMKVLLANSHTFKKNEFLERKFKKIKKGDELVEEGRYAIPEVHLISDIIKAKGSKKIQLKLLPQKLHDKNYKVNLGLYYVVLDESWAVYKLSNSSNNKDEFTETYTKTKKLPKNLDNCLLSSSDLGKSIIDKKEISIELDSWFPKFKGVEFIEEYVFLNSINSWVYFKDNNSVIESKDGKKEIIKNANIVRTLLKSKLKDKVKLHIKKELYSKVKNVLDKYSKEIKDENSENYYFKIFSDSVLNLINELKKINYSIHKGNIVKIK